MFHTYPLSNRPRQAEIYTRTTQEQALTCSFLLHPIRLLQHTHRIRRTRDPAREIQRRAREEETPLVVLAARFGQLFEVEHFADGSAPEGEEDVVEAWW